MLVAIGCKVRSRSVKPFDCRLLPSISINPRSCLLHLYLGHQNSRRQPLSPWNFAFASTNTPHASSILQHKHPSLMKESSLHIQRSRIMQINGWIGSLTAYCPHPLLWLSKRVSVLPTYHSRFCLVVCCGIHSSLLPRGKAPSSYKQFRGESGFHACTAVHRLIIHQQWALRRFRL